MDLDNYYTTRDIEDKFKIKARTITSYISRDQVIPKDKLEKFGRFWLIEKDWADEFWGNKKKG